MLQFILLLMLMLALPTWAQDCTPREEQDPLAALQLDNCIDEFMVDDPCGCHERNMRRLPQGIFESIGDEQKQEIVANALKAFENTQLELIDSVVDIEGAFDFGEQGAVLGQQCSIRRLEQFECVNGAQDSELLGFVKEQLGEIARKSSAEMMLQMSFPLPADNFQGYRDRRFENQICQVPDAFLKHIEVSLFQTQTASALDLLKNMNSDESLHQFANSLEKEDRRFVNTIQNSVFTILLNDNNKQNFLVALQSHEGDLENFLESENVQQMLNEHFATVCGEQDKALQKIACESSFNDLTNYPSIADIPSFTDDRALFFEDEPFETQLEIVSDMQIYCQGLENDNSSFAEFGEYLAAITSPSYQGDFEEVNRITYSNSKLGKQRICVEDNSFEQEITEEYIESLNCDENPGKCDYYRAMREMLLAQGVSPLSLKALVDQKLDDANAIIDEEGVIVAEAEYDLSQAFYATQAPTVFFEQVLGVSQDAQERMGMTAEQVLADVQEEEASESEQVAQAEQTEQQDNSAWTEQFPEDIRAQQQASSQVADNSELHRRLDGFKKEFDAMLNDQSQGQNARAIRENIDAREVNEVGETPREPTPERTVYASSSAPDNQEMFDFMKDFRDYVDRPAPVIPEQAVGMGEQHSYAQWNNTNNFNDRDTHTFVENSDRSINEARESYNEALAEANQAKQAARSAAGANSSATSRAPASAGAAVEAPALNVTSNAQESASGMAELEINEDSFSEDLSLVSEALTEEDIETIRALIRQGDSFILALQNHSEYQVIVKPLADGAIEIEKVEENSEDPLYNNFFSSVQQFLNVHGRTLDTLERLFDY